MHPFLRDRLFVLVVASTLTGNPGEALGQSDSVGRLRRATDLSKIADKEVDQGRYTDALKHRRLALNILARDSLQPLYRWLLRDMGRVFEAHPDIATSGYDSATAYYRHAASIAEAAGDTRSQVYRLIDLGDTEWKKHRDSAASATYSRAASIADIAKDSVAQAYAHRRFAQYLSDHEDYDGSLTEYRRALRSAEAAGDAKESGLALEGLAEGLQVTGYPDSSLVYLKRALPLARSRYDTGSVQAILSGMGDALYSLDSLDQARKWYEDAVKLASESGDTEGLAMALTNSADVLWSLGKNDSARVRYEDALRLMQTEVDKNSSGIARTLGQLAALARERNELDSARVLNLAAHRVAQSAEAWADMGDIDLQMAAVDSVRGFTDSALIHRKKAAEEFERGGLFKQAIEAYVALGEFLDGLRSADSAIANFKRAAVLLPRVKFGEVDRNLLRSVGSTYARLNTSDSAFVFGEQALTAFRARGDRRREALMLQFLASRYDFVGRPDRAIPLDDSALVIAKALGDKAMEASLLNNVGWARALSGAPDEAIPLLRQAIALSKAERFRTTELAALHSLGFAYGQLGLSDSLRFYYTESVRLRRDAAVNGDNASRLTLAVGLSYLADAVSRSFPDSALKLNGEALTIARDVRDESAESEALRGIGTTLAHRHHSMDLAAATAYFDSAASLMSFVRGRAGEELNRLRFAERSLRLFEEWTLSWLARSDEIGPEAAAFGALASAERGRAQALLDLARGTPEIIPPGADMVAHGRTLVKYLGDGVGGLIYLAARDSLIVWSVSPKGTIQAEIVPIKRDSLATLIAGERADLGVDDAHTDARLALRGDPSRINPQPVRDSLFTKSADDSSAVEDALIHALFPPGAVALLRSAREIVVIPQGAIALVPFTGLHAPRSKQKLGELVAIRYTPSLTMLVSATKVTHGETGKALVIGNPTMPVVNASGDRIILKPISESKVEASDVATFLMTTSLDSAAATEAEVKRRMPRASIIHLATHGYAYASEQRARDSFVALAPGDGEDGLLTVGEILDGPGLDADLVVLSACQTALGDLKQAEGTIGFQRAFLAKGARSVLVSLWSVADDATALLMRKFYEYWRRGTGMTKALALQRAQEYVRTHGFADSRFWAPFQLVGAD